MVRFVHTSDWQLGMTRHYLSPEAQARFTDARLQAIRAIGELTRSSEAQFVLVAGDVFESNLVDRQLVLRALEAMRESSVQFYLLPGNHDPLAPGSVYLSPVFLAHCPPNVTVLDGAPLEVAPGATLLSAPWRSKRMQTDPLTEAFAAAAETPGLKIVAGHGRCDLFAPNPDDRDLIRTADAEAAIAAGAAHYIALGDRHSQTSLSVSHRMWYSGTPEPTEYRETDPGFVLLVELSAESCAVEPRKLATWRFTETTFSISDAADAGRLRSWLDGLPSKDRTVLNLGLEGTISLSVAAEIDEVIEHFRPMFAAIERRERDSDLFVVPAETDFGALSLSGFAAEAAHALADDARNSTESTAAGDALRLLHRLARGAA